MRDYQPGTSGDRIAAVYDDRAARDGRLDTPEAVELLAQLAGPGPVLELGIGTGRLALPLAERGSTSTASTPPRPWWRGSGPNREASASR